MYWVMGCDGEYPVASIDKYPKVRGFSWMSGKMITAPIDEPLLYTIDPDYPGEPKAMYDEKILLMRDDLLASLRGAGVDNLQTFQAILRDPRNGTDRTNFKSVNIVGVVSCADEARSQRMGTSTSTMIDVDYHSLVIDEKKTGGALLFRLAEAVSAIVVHDKVKTRVVADGIAGMTFFGPGEWSG
jgi:uncharacterized protein DUF1629